MEDDIPLFCTQCGATLRENATFCQECGTPVSGTVAGGTQAYQGTGADKHKGRLLIVTGLLVTLAAFALYLGVIIVLNMDDMIFEVMNNPETVPIMIQYGITEEMLREVMTVMGYLFIAVGILALIDAALTFTRRYWGIALALTVILTVIMFSSIIGLLFGILVFYFQYAAKSEFTQQ